MGGIMIWVIIKKYIAGVNILAILRAQSTNHVAVSWRMEDSTLAFHNQVAISFEHAALKVERISCERRKRCPDYGERHLVDEGKIQIVDEIHRYQVDFFKC